MLYHTAARDLNFRIPTVLVRGMRNKLSKESLLRYRDPKKDFFLLFIRKRGFMHDMFSHPNHISSILGKLVTKWWDSNPEAIRAIEKFNREHKNVLIEEGDKKRKILAEIRLKNFKGTATGQRIDLTIYKQLYEPLNEEALKQKADLEAKEGV